jgi:hypothetical protein
MQLSDQNKLNEMKPGYEGFREVLKQRKTSYDESVVRLKMTASFKTQLSNETNIFLLKIER